MNCVTVEVFDGMHGTSRPNINEGGAGKGLGLSLRTRGNGPISARVLNSVNDGRWRIEWGYIKIHQ